MIKAIIFDFYGVLNVGMLPNDELTQYIEKVLKNKYKLGIISNAADSFMYEIIPENDLRAIFKDITISYKVGINKPEAGIYRHSLQKLGVKAEEAIFIDDIERHCKAAEGIGMKAILYQDFPQMKKDLEAILASSKH